MPLLLCVRVLSACKGAFSLLVTRKNTHHEPRDPNHDLRAPCAVSTSHEKRATSHVIKETHMRKTIISTTALLLFTAASAFAWNVPDTGQTQSYTATFGEDSDYTCNPHSYTDLGNGIVRDNVTGLEWVKDGNLIKNRDPGFDKDGTSGDGAVTWQHALDYVAKLNAENYLNHNDWRLPTIKELSTLVDSSIPYPGPSINTTFFPGTVASYYWSSTTSAYDTSYAWRVYFYNGDVELKHKSNNYYVRAVRGGPLD